MWLTAGLAGGLAACRARVPPVVAAPEPPPPAAEPPVDVAALIERGCFSCLERALTEARRQNLPDLAFEALVLLSLRGKELGMPFALWLDEARKVAEGDPARQVFVEIAGAIPVDPLTGREEAFARRPVASLKAAVGGWLEALRTTTASDVFTGYLDLAVRCAGFGPVERPETTIRAGLRERPIIRYRLGICGNGFADELRAAQTAVPEFSDADYPLGGYALQRRPYPDIDEAIRRYVRAAAAFPQSPAIATSLGLAYQGIEDWRASLTAFDAALALVPDHPDALRGRIVSLSTLEEHRAAIESATRLAEGRWYRGEGYYWRAWNYFQVEQYDLARADADSMKSLLVNSRASMLSGLIYWRLRQLDPAEVDFELSVTQDAGNCQASTFLGGVRNERGKTNEALAAFIFARRCFDLEVTVRREAIRQLQASDAPEAYKTRELARHERALAAAERRRDEAANGVAVLEKYLTSIQAPQTPVRQ